MTCMELSAWEVKTVFDDVHVTICMGSRECLRTCMGLSAWAMENVFDDTHGDYLHGKWRVFDDIHGTFFMGNGECV